MTIWGSRGSVASPGPDTIRYGGNTSCVEVRGDDGTLLALDAGTGIRRLGAAIPDDVRRVDVLLTHLHMDHIQGLGFFAPLRRPGAEVHIWGPIGNGPSLRARLGRYLSPPLFPVHLRELQSALYIHELPNSHATIDIGEFQVSAAVICHPDPTIGYRIASGSHAIAYLPDHEPALGLRSFTLPGEWVSGYSLARDVDLLIHDAQYTDDEYDERIGWGHSSIRQAFEFARLAGAHRLAPFHHDPTHDDDTLDRLISAEQESTDWPFAVESGAEGATYAF